MRNSPFKKVREWSRKMSAAKCRHDTCSHTWPDLTWTMICESLTSDGRWRYCWLTSFTGYVFLAFWHHLRLTSDWRWRYCWLTSITGYVFLSFWRHLSPCYHGDRRTILTNRNLVNKQNIIIVHFYPVLASPISRSVVSRSVVSLNERLEYGAFKSR